MAALIVERAGAPSSRPRPNSAPDMQASIAEDCRSGRAILKPETTIKGSGSCFNLDALLLNYRNGAPRFGASETANILEDLRARIAKSSLH